MSLTQEQLALALLLAVASSARAVETLEILAVNYPLRYFAERIAGEHAVVALPAPPGEDPAFWRPGVETIARYQEADLVLLNGAGYAKWVEQASLRWSRTVDTSRHVAERYLQVEGVTTHAHGPKGEYAHEGTAFTLWLDPQLAREQARSIERSLSRRYPEHAAAFATNLAGLEQDLVALDQDLDRATRTYRDQPLLASHPVYQYLGRRYGLELKSVLWEPGQMPSDAEWRALEALLASYPAQRMLWEAQPLPEIRARLAELGVAVVVFEPGANVPENSDYLALMRANVARLETAAP